MTITKALAAASLFALGSAHAGFVNGGFETTLVPVPNDSYIITHQDNVPGWRTTSADLQIEIWDDGFNGFGYPGFPIGAYEGKQFAEINATQHAMLYQDAVGIEAGAEVGFEFAHRGRAGVDTMRLTIVDLGADGLDGGGDDTLLFSKEYSTGNGAWGFYDSSSEATIVALGNNIRFGYASVAVASGDHSIGNFVDAIDFGVGVAPPIPEPGTWALMAAGIGWLGLRRRRRD